MGKNKNKRIQKSLIKPKQPEQLQAFHSEGIFSNMEEREHQPIIIQSQSEQAQSQKAEQNNTDTFVIVNAEKCGNGFLFNLNIGKLYQVFNPTQNNGHVWVLDGLAQSNFRVFDHWFDVLGEHSIIFQARSTNQTKKSQTSFNKQSKKQRIQKILNKIQNQQILENLQSLDQHTCFNSASVILFTLCSTLSISEVTNKPKQWQGLSVEQFLEKSPKTMVIGPKNSGKSTFCQSLLNYSVTNNKNICILDIDIGRNLYYPGTVSLTIFTTSTMKEQHIALWIGEFTPLNNVKLYMEAIDKLLEEWKSKYFYCSLIVNTMGYLTGIGELVIYQVYDKVKPDLILTLNGSKDKSKNDDWTLKNITKTIQTGEYVNRLHLSFIGNPAVKPTACSSKAIWYRNLHASQKHNLHGQHFQKYLSKTVLNGLQDLLILLHSPSSSLKPIPSSQCLELYRKKQSGLIQLEFYTALHIQMRIVVLGRFWHGFLEVLGFGYGWNGQIYYDPKLINHKDVRIGVLTDGVDLEKKFYQISQNKLIQLQDMIGKRVPFLLPNYQVLGSKGMRNNPAKKNINI